MLSILVQSPWLAAVVALGLWALWKWRQRKVARAAAVAWALYCGYEYLMYTRVLCSGECNIRIDLLAIYPVIGILALLAVVTSVGFRRTGTSSSTTDAQERTSP